MERAENIFLETDEDGFHLVIETLEERYDFNIEGSINELIHAGRVLNDWLAEGYRAKKGMSGT